MTPTEQDKELLREQVHKLFGDNQVYDSGYQSCYDGKWIDMTDEVCAVADFIIADRKRVALEARIDAAEHILNTMVHEAGGYCDEIGPDAIPNYIAELKAQQEEEARQDSEKDEKFIDLMIAVADIDRKKK